ncbi:unnamed protein product [Miscanthus lutarioriparius]|uniref:protein-serine/threonine phosphatase n=1 Tax=Miscanthus lutarioriparius TaxID=422564 RepID=A0A811PI18_9POAL|nr:unnamed protein product [Miscanthus lutarioriparius]
MSDMKRGVNDDDAPRCPPHPRFVRGLCFLCGVKEEDTEGGALAVAVGHEMMKEEGDDHGNDDPARCPAHPEIVLGLSYRCGATEEDAGGRASGVTVANIDRALVLPGCAAATSTAGTSDLATLFRERKLILVLDLDRTLLNSTRLDGFSAGERWFGFTPDTGNKVDMDLFRLDSDNLGMLTKLRPFVRGFLEQASSKFEMHVYTLGNQSRVKGLVDPGGTKSLDVIPGADPVAAVILDALDLDDTDVAWPGHQDNLILTNRYRYFASTCRKSRFDIPSLAEQGRDEKGEHGGSLGVALGVLERVHHAFFDGPRADVREVITELRGQVLRGCTVAFSYLEQRMEDSPDDTRLWTLAERLGAICRKDVDQTVTHVVAEDPGTQKAKWARDHGKFLVNPEWIKAASFRWCRQDAQEFPVTARRVVREPIELVAAVALFYLGMRSQAERLERNHEH